MPVPHCPDPRSGPRFSGTQDEQVLRQRYRSAGGHRQVRRGCSPYDTYDRKCTGQRYAFLLGESRGQPKLRKQGMEREPFHHDEHRESAGRRGKVLQTSRQADKWILSKVNDLAKEVTENMDKYELGIALQKVYDFVWEEFCDWYIEMVKPRLWNDEDRTKAAAIWTLKTVLINSLKLLHPFMPFITEEIFCNLQDEEPSIMISSWPVYKEEWNFAADEHAVEVIKEAVRAIRNVRTSMNVPPSRKAKVFVVTEDADLTDIFENSRVFFSTLASASEVVIQKDKTGIGEDAVSAVIPKAAIYMPFAELVDIEKETERLKKEEERLTKELARVNGMLANEKFVSKAPQAKIDEEKAKLQKYTEMMEQVKTRLAQLGK